MSFKFVLESVDPSGARAGRIETDHGVIETPAFMPVGTQGTVKTMSSRDLTEIGAGIILSNTYHLYLRPGVEVIAEAGGLHNFMSWGGAILTDSGGYQVLSLSDLRRVTDEGVEFRSHLDGSTHFLTPRKVVDLQIAIGSDIMMVLDECTSYPCDRPTAEEAVERTTRWAEESLEPYGASSSVNGYEQVLFGIVQGSVYPDLRERSVRELASLGFGGYAIGGLSVGEPKEEMFSIVDLVTSLLPEEKPRYLMGVGFPTDIINAVERGVDMFDCVMPTRNARNGTIFTSHGKLVLKNAQHAKDFSPIDEDCECEVCKNYSRAYLRHLFNAGELLAPRLATYHSLYFYLHLMGEMRQVIREGRFRQWKEDFFSKYGNKS